MNQEKTLHLIQELLEGSISPQELAVLETELRESEHARELLIECSEIHSMLEQQVVNVPAISNVIPIEIIIARQKKRTAFRSSLVAVAVLALLGIFLRLVLVPEQEPMLSYRISEGTIFEMTHADSEDPPEGMVMKKGSHMKLVQGTVELTLASGVKSIVQAPADFTLHEEKKLYLDHGTAWFEVAEEGKGFVVQTPTLTVTDYGTEFGIISGHNQYDEVHLLKGKIEVVSRHSLKKSETLSGATARMTGAAGRLKKIELQPKTFMKVLPKGLPHLYWSFDEGFQPEGDHVAVEKIEAEAVSSPKLIAGKIGKALSLSGDGQHIATNWQGISGNRPRTVAFWIHLGEKAKGFPGNGSAIIGWGNPSERNAKWKVHTASDNPDGRIFPRVSFGTDWFDGSTPLDDGKWHHFVTVYRGHTLENGLPDFSIYIDGREEPLRKRSLLAPPKNVYTETEDINSKPLTIGKGISAGNATFEGTIDELYIYDGALLEEDVQQLLIRSQ